MITKEAFCKHILHEYCKINNKNMSQLDSQDAITSTTVGKAMTFLGMINDIEIKKYLAKREGQFITYIDTKKERFYSLSCDEMLDLLPDEVL